MKKILNIAGYQFIELIQLIPLKTTFEKVVNDLQLKGTILISPEGINISLAGEESPVRQFIHFLQNDTRFKALSFRESYSDFVPFKRLKVKIKKEIITLRQADIAPQTQSRVSALLPETLKKWLDEGRAITLLDTRNDYECHFGTFEGAVELGITDFSHFPDVSDTIPKDKPVVMFCTGGVRCEKAALVMQKQGYETVYQLEGGILRYFAEVGEAHYKGDCFVFDQRIALTPALTVSQQTQATICLENTKQAKNTTLKEI